VAVAAVVAAKVGWRAVLASACVVPGCGVVARGGGEGGWAVEAVAGANVE